MGYENAGRERLYPLNLNTNLFIGEKPTAVYFGEERVPVKTWRTVFKLLLDRCNQEYHDNLMNLRDKVMGSIHVYLSESPNGMVTPIKLDEGLFADRGRYGTATLLYILRDRILKPAQYDYYNIRIALRSKYIHI